MSKVLDEARKLMESIGDNTVDNIVDELARATAIELDMFVADLLAKKFAEFRVNYNTPNYEDFKTSFKMVLNRYQLMSGDEEGDLHQKIKLMFLNIFSSRYNAGGHEVADVIAVKYSEEMIKFLKRNKHQANKDLAVDKSEVYY